MNDITMDKALSMIEQAEKAGPEERSVMRQDRLNDLVAYAREYSTYFKEYYKNVEDEFSLTDLPPCNKRDLMVNFDHWVTDSSITSDSIKEYLAAKENIGRLFLDKYSVLTTSGTSGVPLTMVRDSYHNIIHGALMKVRLFRELDPE